VPDEKDEKDGFAQGLVGVVLDGRYRLDAVLGEGGMGAVFRAHHLAMDRKVAVKLLKPHLTNDDTALRRFAREAKSTLKVESPHAVKVLDFGVTPLRDYYMVLEYLDGRTVQRELDVDGTFAPARVIHIGRHALAALGAAHKLGLVHRDVKPDNILLMRVGDNPDFAKILDFGVAKLMEGSALAANASLALTQAGMVFGTPEFMSPEQACGQALDGRSDLYSLAATMFAMLTGCGLFDGKSAIEWLTHHARTPPPHLGEISRELAPYRELDAVLQRCLAKQRDDRPHDAAAMSALLERIEPLVQAGAKPGQGAGTALRATLFSPSSYLEALKTPTPTGPTARSRTAADASIVEPASRKRGLALALGAIIVVGVVAAAIVLANSRTSRSASIPVDARAAVVTVDAAPPDGAPVVVDAARVVIAVDAAPAPVDAAAHREVRRTEAEAHVKAAEDARRTHNGIGELTEADLAHQLDPRNVRAMFLIGDAMIETGDLANGCPHLRALPRYAEAKARADSAGCPTP